MADLISHVITGMKRLSGPLARRWRKARTHRHINELPDHILDDIGWPAAYMEPAGQGRRSPKGEDYLKQAVSESRIANRLQDAEAMENRHDDHHYRL